MDSLFGFELFFIVSLAKTMKQSISLTHDKATCGGTNLTELLKGAVRFTRGSRRSVSRGQATFSSSETRNTNKPPHRTIPQSSDRL